MAVFGGWLILSSLLFVNPWIMVITVALATLIGFWRDDGGGRQAGAVLRAFVWRNAAHTWADIGCRAISRTGL
jgi:hypothetical protein